MVKEHLESKSIGSVNRRCVTWEVHGLKWKTLL